MKQPSVAGSKAWRTHQSLRAWKASQLAVINGVNYANVVATLLYKSGLIHFLKAAVFSLFYRATLSPKPYPRSTVVFYAHRYRRRPDYDYIVDTLDSASGGGNLVELTNRIDLSQPFRLLACLPTARRAVSSLEMGSGGRTLATLLVGRFLSEERTLRSLVEGRSLVATFSDAHPFDNMVAQLANLQRAKTVTAQHGQYRVLDERNMSADVEMYDNFVSDLMLIWGPATMQEMVRSGVSPERLLTTGWIREWPPPRKSAQSAPRAVFGVILNGANGHSSNYELLRIAEQLCRTLGLGYVARVHPSHGASDYARFAPSCSQMTAMETEYYRDRVAFSLANASSAAIEMLMLGELVYVLDDGAVADVFRVPGLCFSVADLLKQAVTDRAEPEAALSRIQKLKAWYDDDEGQARSLSQALSGVDANRTGE